MARSRRWTNEYRKRQIELFGDVWKAVVLSAFTELNRISGFKHHLVELNDVHPARAAGLYAEAWLQAPRKLARETDPSAGDTMNHNRAVLSVALTLLAAPVLAGGLNPDAVRSLWVEHRARWTSLVARARVLAFDEPDEAAAFEQRVASRGVARWLPANRHNWVGANHRGASSVAAHERMNAVVDAYFDDVYRVEQLTGPRLRLLSDFPPFTLVDDPVQGGREDQTAYDRRCELVDVHWHRRFADELREHGFAAHLEPVLSATSARESRMLPAYRPEAPPALSAFWMVTILAVGKDLRAAVGWVEAGGATGACADLACIVLAALAHEAGDLPPPELQRASDGAQARALAVCVAALDAAPVIDQGGDHLAAEPPDDTSGGRR